MIEIERKDTKKIKLTIAHDEKVRLKIPPRFSEEEVEEIKTYVEGIVKERGPQEKTFRTTLLLDWIRRGKRPKKKTS